MNTCQCCGGAPLYYDDRTNGQYLCRRCYSALADGKTPPMTARKTEIQALALPAYDDAASRTLAETFAEQHTRVEQVVLACVVESPETEQKAAEWGNKIRERLELTRKELEFATSLRRLANQYSARWNPAIQPLERALDHLRKQLEGYTLRSRAAVAVTLPQAQTQAEIQAATAAIVPKPAEIQHRESWSAEVTMSPVTLYTALAALGDPRVDALLRAALPAEYLVPDQSRLNREAREQKAAFAVPGARAVRGIGVAFTS